MTSPDLPTPTDRTGGRSPVAVRRETDVGRPAPAYLPTVYRPSRWAWLLVLLVGVGLFLAVLRTLQATDNPNLVPALIVLGAAVVPGSFVAFVASRRLALDVSGGIIGLMALLGGVIGIVIAGTLEYDAAQRLGTASIVFVGIIEEAAKLAVPLGVVLLVRNRWREPVDGLVIGVATGAGFAALETMGYAFVELVRSGGQLGPVIGILVLRGLLSPAAHLAWTGLTVSALWWARWRDWRVRSVVLLVVAYLVAVVLHTLWDLSGGLLGNAIVAVVSLLLLFVVAHRLARHQSERAAVTGARPVQVAG